LSYEVLARKWRPGSFNELVGQEHVVRALVNALDSNRLHHAFLFTGTRGVGKTTIARILSKSLNCEKGVSSTPCNQCSACIEANEGRFIDLIEVDAASKTKVDDTRELLDNVQYAPTRGRYKIYLIDEVHMLSGHSFNALLKTLEEPPPHVKFLLATTEPQKLPVTVLSRCLQFSLKRLSREQISDQLKHILESENVQAENSAIDAIARAADGSMRDALSLLDQAISFGAGALLASEVTDMLGTIDPQGVDNILAALQNHDAEALMAAVESLVQVGGDHKQIVDALLLRLHDIAMVQTDEKLANKDAANYEKLLEFASSISPADIQLYYQIALHGKRDLPLAPDPRTGLEMMILRMLAFQPADDVNLDTAFTAARPEPKQKQQASQATVAPATVTAVSELDDRSKWSDIIEHLELSPLVRQLCSNSSMEKNDNNEIMLTLDSSCAQLLNKEREQELRNALIHLWGEQTKLAIEVGTPKKDTPAREAQKALDAKQAAAENAINEDTNIQALKENFGATIKPGSVRSRA